VDPAEPMTADVPPYLRLNFVTDALPWQPGTVAEIICLHAIEHMSRHHGIVLLKRAVDLLAPGAQLTVTTPDLRILCERYVARDRAFFEYIDPKGRTGAERWPGATLADRFNWAIHPPWGQNREYVGHVWIYDQEALMQLAAEADVRAVPIPDTSPYGLRHDHETGIVCTRR